MAPVSPFGVPQTLSAAFFGGLWGIAYAAAEPWLAARLGWLAGGLAFGILPLVVLWFVVFPLKGIPVGGGFTAFGFQHGVVLHVKSEERRGGTEGVRQCSTRWSPDH